MNRCSPPLKRQLQLLMLAMPSILIISVIVISVGFEVSRTQGITTAVLRVPTLIEITATYSFGGVFIKACFGNDNYPPPFIPINATGAWLQMCNPGVRWTWAQFMEPANQVQSDMTSFELDIYTSHAVVGYNLNIWAITFCVIEIVGWFLTRLSTKYDPLNTIIIPLSIAIIIMLIVAITSCLKSAFDQINHYALPVGIPSAQKYSKYQPGSAVIILGIVLQCITLALAFVLRSKRREFARSWQAGRENDSMEEEGVAALRPNDSL